MAARCLPVIVPTPAARERKSPRETWHSLDVLDRDEADALAEIEASLRRDDPEFVWMIERLEYSPFDLLDGSDFPQDLSEFESYDEDAVPVVVGEHSRRRWARVLVTAVAAVIAVAITLGVTALWGPDAGGLAGVVSIMAASMVGYQLLRGCPGRR